MRYAWIAMFLALSFVGGAAAQNHAPNPYRAIPKWGKLPGGRTWGSTSAVYPTPDGKMLWVAERCGANNCAGSDVDPILLFDLNGNLVRSFGKGLMVWPHGIHVDQQGNVWIADAVSASADYEPPPGMGHVVLKFSPEGELLMTLGQKGVKGRGPYVFNKPSDVLVAPNGDIFVADGHSPDGNNRIVKYSPEGKFIREWGVMGKEDGEFRDPHALAMDSEGRLYVGDRWNSRIQIFDQNGKHLETWTQFGRPSGIFIDKNDMIYVTDSESNRPRNPGWKRGIRIGSAKDAFVRYFIPDPEKDQDNSLTSGAEGVAVDANGAIYGAEVGPQQIVKYVRR